MPTIETKIWLTLKGRLQALVLSPVHEIAWPNEDFSPEVNSPYLRATWIPNINRRILLGSDDPHERLGIFQIDVFSKINQNSAIALETAGLVAAHFPADLKMDSQGLNCRVQKAPDVAQAIPQETRWMVPVTVNIVTYG